MAGERACGGVLPEGSWQAASRAREATHVAAREKKVNEVIFIRIAIKNKGFCRFGKSGRNSAILAHRGESTGVFSSIRRCSGSGAVKLARALPVCRDMLQWCTRKSCAQRANSMQRSSGAS